MWRLRQRMASRWVLPSLVLRGMLALCLGVAAGSGDGHAMDGGVDLAVAAAVESVAVGAPGAGRDLQLGPQVVQVPLPRAVDRHAGPDQPLTVIDEQSQVELPAGQGAGRQRLDA